MSLGIGRGKLLTLGYSNTLLPSFQPFPRLCLCNLLSQIVPKEAIFRLIQNRTRKGLPLSLLGKEKQSMLPSGISGLSLSWVHPTNLQQGVGDGKTTWATCFTSRVSTESPHLMAEEVLPETKEESPKINCKSLRLLKNKTFIKDDPGISTWCHPVIYFIIQM